MKKVVRPTTKAVIVLGALLAGYYLLFLGPNLAKLRALNKVEKNLISLRSGLVQTRIFLLELTSLNPSSPNFNEEKDILLGKLNETNQNTIEAAEERNSVNPLLETDIRKNIPLLLAKTKNILEDQQELIEALSKLDAETANIFLYDPQIDLSTDDQEEIIERVASAQAGLNDISKSLEALAIDSPEVHALQNKIPVLVAALSEIKNQNSSKGKVIDQFIQLRKLAYEAEIALIKTDSSVTLLTNQTNLILEYDFWLGKIKEARGN